MTATVTALDADTRADEDRALVERFRAGDEAAFDALVRNNQDRVYGLLWRMLGNREDALDLAQDTFVRAYRGIDGFRAEARFSTWVYGIALNLARNRLRDRTRKGRDRGMSLETLETDAPGAVPAGAAADCPRAAAEHGELTAALEACLEHLPETLRGAFALRVFEGLAYEEIADAMECPRGTVKSRLNDARRRLADCLERRGVIGGDAA
jgi:RNA polymerase sigma-70 factor (ECF subfamily)